MTLEESFSYDPKLEFYLSSSPGNTCAGWDVDDGVALAAG